MPGKYDSVAASPLRGETLRLPSSMPDPSGSARPSHNSSSQLRRHLFYRRWQLAQLVNFYVNDEDIPIFRKKPPQTANHPVFFPSIAGVLRE